MDPELWQIVYEIFDKLQDYPPEERVERIDPVMEELEVPVHRRDDARAEVLKLLAADGEKTQSIVKEPSESFSTWALGFIGKTLGGYKIMRCLGEGSFGSVFLAQQTEPVRQLVAVKVLIPGPSNDEIEKRFQGESTALAQMNHAGIVKVFDAGEDKLTEVVRLKYFAMELVDGPTITEYVEAHRPTTRERLELFLKILEGVHHAHSRALIHRDLKPSNILVSETGAQPQPKIIDFGIARPLTGRDWTVYTAREQMMGTPRYMSPEQCGRHGHDVQVTSDVYSLGVILYELLTGKLPYVLEGLALPEVTEIIRTRPPLKMKEVGSELSGDLELIVQKALEKERGRRYQSAHEFATDIQRFLDREPILARPPSLAYQLKMYALRNQARAAVVSIAAVFLIVLVAVFVAFNAQTAAHAEKVFRLAESQQMRTLEETAALLVWGSETDLAMYDEWQESARNLMANRAILASTLLDWDIEGTRWLRELSDSEMTDELATFEANLREWRSWEEKIATRLGSDPGRVDPETLHQIEQSTSVRKKIQDQVGTIDRQSWWTFDDRVDSWSHESLEELMVKLGALPKLMKTVEARREEAETVREATVGNARVLEDWERDRRHVADPEGPYQGEFELEPQLGLVPLGPDPRSNLLEYFVYGTGTLPDRQTLLLPEEREATFGVILILLPGGRADIGATSTDPDSPRYLRDTTRYEQSSWSTKLAPFFISKFEITQHQWKLMTGTNPSFHNPDRKHEGLPASWDIPLDSVNWVTGSRTLPLFRMDLPTEAQWEYGAQGARHWDGETGNFPFSFPEGADVSKHANLCAVEVPQNRIVPDDWKTLEITDGWVLQAPVGSYLPNDYGLHDVHGNVFEWCKDGFDGGYRHSSDDVDPDTGLVISTKDSPAKSYRGGSYRYTAGIARLSYRLGRGLTGSAVAIGFRPVRALTYHSE